MIVLPASYFVMFIKRKIKPANKGYLFAGACIILGQIFSLINSINIYRSFSVVLFSLLTLSYSYILFLLIKTENAFSKALKYLICIGSIVSLLSIWQFIRFGSGADVMLPFERFVDSKTITAESFEYSVNGNSYLRPSSTFVDVNITGGFLLVVVLLNATYLIEGLAKRKFKPEFWGFLSLFILNFSAFLLTVSRSAYLGLLIGGLIFLFINLRSILNFRVLIMFVILLFSSLMIMIYFDTPIEAMWGRFHATFITDDSTGSTQKHAVFSQSAFDIFRNNSLFGIGAGNFEEYYLTNIDNTEETAYTYNVYLGFLSETGIFGFLGQIYLIAYVIYSVIKSLNKMTDITTKLKTSSLLCAFVGILIANLFYAYYILFFVWMLIGLQLSVSSFEFRISNEDNS